MKNYVISLYFLDTKCLLFLFEQLSVSKCEIDQFSFFAAKKNNLEKLFQQKRLTGS
jgi:hypothetical protein